MVSFGLSCALFALSLAMSGVEVGLEVCPGLVGWECVKPSVAIVKVDSRVVDDGIGSIDNLLVGECPISGLGLCLDFFDAAE